MNFQFGLLDTLAVNIFERGRTYKLASEKPLRLICSSHESWTRKHWRSPIAEVPSYCSKFLLLAQVAPQKCGFFSKGTIWAQCPGNPRIHSMSISYKVNVLVNSLTAVPEENGIPSATSYLLLRSVGHITVMLIRRWWGFGSDKKEIWQLLYYWNYIMSCTKYYCMYMYAVCYILWCCSAHRSLFIIWSRVR